MSFTFKDAAGATQTAPSPNANGQATMANSAPVVPPSDLANIEPAGVPITGAAMPAGGVGHTGWLSAIWKALTGTLTVGGTVAVSNLPGTQPVSGTVALGPGVAAIGSIGNTAFGVSGTLPAFAATPTVNIGTAPAIALAAGGAAIGTVGVTGSVAVTGTFWQATQPVSGTVSANSTIVAALPAGANLIGSVLVPETTFFNDTTTAIAASTTYSGTARDVGVAAGTATPSTYFNAFFFADQIGTANVQCSNDGAAWRTIATAAIAVSTPLLLSVPVMTRYHRVQLVNGATLQTAVMVNSSYSGS